MLLSHKPRFRRTKFRNLLNSQVELPSRQIEINNISPGDTSKTVQIWKSLVYWLCLKAVKVVEIIVSSGSDVAKNQSEMETKL